MPYLGSFSIAEIHSIAQSVSTVSTFSGGGAGGRRMKRWDFTIKRLVHKI